jgi:hypothetical protein
VSKIIRWTGKSEIKIEVLNNNHGKLVSKKMHSFTFALFILPGMRPEIDMSIYTVRRRTRSDLLWVSNLEARPMCLSKLFIHQNVAKPLSWATASVTSVALVDFPEESL